MKVHTILRHIEVYLVVSVSNEVSKVFVGERMVLL